jgi:hypothetical protein
VKGWEQARARRKGGNDGAREGGERSKSRFFIYCGLFNDAAVTQTIQPRLTV